MSRKFLDDFKNRLIFSSKRFAVLEYDKEKIYFYSSLGTFDSRRYYNL